MADRFWDNKEEVFVGAALQFPLYFIVGWWVLMVMPVTGLFWRLGGWSEGNKLWRRAGVPLAVCVASLIAGVSWPILLAVPFMLWLNPMSYGEDGWLQKALGDDFLIRIIGYAWYWLMFSAGYALGAL
jgi:hypothetical protein